MTKEQQGPGLKITACQQTMSNLDGDLTGQNLHSWDMLTGHAYSHSRTNSQILICKS